MFGKPAIQPPGPVPPPPNPPTYASAAGVTPDTSMGKFGGFSSTILTGPMGAPDQRSAQRKVLLGA